MLKSPPGFSALARALWGQIERRKAAGRSLPSLLSSMEEYQGGWLNKFRGLVYGKFFKWCAAAVVNEVEFSTDLIKGPKSFVKKWPQVLKSGVVKSVRGRLILEYSFWSGEVILRIRLYEAATGKDLYKNDVKVFAGFWPTKPFKKVSRTIDVEVPVNTKVEEAVLELELAVYTYLGSLSGRVVNLTAEVER